MIIGLSNRTGIAAQLTHNNPKSAEVAASTADQGAPQSSDKISLSGHSLASRLQSARSEVSEKKEFLSQHEHVPNQVLVRLKSEVSGLTDFAAEYGSKVLHHFDLTGLKPSVRSSEQLMLLDLQGDLSVAEAMVLMGQDDRVSVVESNDIVRHQLAEQETPPQQGTPPQQPPQEPDPTPNDMAPQLWGLHNEGQDGGTAGIDIDIKSAWKTTIGSRTGPIVAVIDSGVDINHPDLKANIFVNEGEIPGDGIDNDGNGAIDDVNGYNAAEDSNDPSDDHGHGTHVAGTIGAVGNNGKGITGVNQEARILPVRFLSKEGSGTTADAIRALVYASRTGSRVVNNSWGGSKYNQLVFDVLSDSEALHVCAAGNEAYDNDVRPVYPASYELDNIISVTAHDRNNKFPKFANRGETTVDLAAPGVDIYSTVLRKKYEAMSGTSMASPHVAGVATLIATAKPDVTNEELRFLLMHNLDELPARFGDRIISGGRLNAGLALEKDTVKPATVTDLKVESVKPDAINVSWVATGDDGKVGRAAAYDVRLTSGQFGQGEPSQGVPFEDAQKMKVGRPKEANQKESFSFDVSPSGKERSFSLGVKAIDNVLNIGEAATLTVKVPAAKVALEDNADSVQETGFELGEDWSRVAVPGRGMVFTESPDGEYPADRNAVLLSKPFSLKGFKNPVLHFESKFEVEKKHDKFVVEIEKRGWFGKSWKKVASYDGKSDWQNHKLDLSRYTGKDDVKIRFRMVSDKDRNRDGVYLDNIVIAEKSK